MESAILRTVAYADVFDYPMTPAEVHRYLIGAPAAAEQVDKALQNGRLVPCSLARCHNYVMLPGREEIVSVRQQRMALAERLWPCAASYGRIIAALPFVRMVAVTGSLAVDNPDSDGDIDFLVVTSPDRLWLCRALVIAVVRWAAGRGDVVCPNYFLSERALALEKQDLFIARELAHMVPLHGLDVYERIRQENAWSADFLPNAAGPPPRAKQLASQRRRRWVRSAVPARRAAEAMLRTELGGRLERWEMARKVRKFHRQYPDHQTEAAFAADWCKGHFDGHGQRILAAFSQRLQALEEAGL